MRIGFPLKGGSFVDVKEKSSPSELDTRENYRKIILKADYDGTFSSKGKLLTRKKQISSRCEIIGQEEGTLIAGDNRKMENEIRKRHVTSRDEIKIRTRK